MKRFINKNKPILFIFLILFCIALFSSFSLFNSLLGIYKEGFTWSQDSANQFIQLQHTINPGIVFDTNEIQNQASQQEVNSFLQNGTWTWSDDVQSSYKNAVLKNPFIRTDPQNAIDYLQTIYNENAIKEILFGQSKEGQFLQRGVQIFGIPNPNEDLPSGWGSFGYKSRLISPMKDVIKCDGNNSLQRITYTGKGGIFNQQTKKITPVDYNNLENLLPGFQFTDEPCNPCISDHSCSFSLHLKN